MKIITKVLSGVIYVAVAFVFIIVGPSLLGNRPVVILSGSMEPAYPVGSITYYRTVPFEEISIGDVITFSISDEGVLATHRVINIDISGQSFTVKGDNNETKDSNTIFYSEVRGKTVDFAIPYAGYYISCIRKWYVLIILETVLVLNMIIGSKQEKCCEAESVPTLSDASRNRK